MSTEDYFAQTFTLDSPNGRVEVSLAALDDFNAYSLKICVNYGAQLGASIAMLITLLLLSKPGKRLSPVMIVNALSLVFNIIRNVLYCIYYVGPFNTVYSTFANDISRIRTIDISNSVGAVIVTTLVLICVETSLCLQVKVICCTLPQLQRRAIVGVSMFLASLAISFRMAYMVNNARLIVTLQDNASLLWLGIATNAVTAASVVGSSAVFVVKLALALRSRHKMGLKSSQSGPMRVLFIMGCQTLIVPAIFAVLQNFVDTPALSSNTLTVCAVFLPLSALWASSTLPDKVAASTPYTPAYNSATPAQKKSIYTTTTMTLTSSSPLQGKHTMHVAGVLPLSPTSTLDHMSHNSSHPGSFEQSRPLPALSAAAEAEMRGYSQIDRDLDRFADEKAV